MASKLDFGRFKRVVEAQFAKMQKDNNVLFISKAEPDALYETYLSSFPAGTNNVFRERGEHECSACRSFIRNAGGVLAIKDNKLVSIWDIEIDDEYQVVANALSNLAKTSGIDTIYLSTFPNIGHDHHIEIINGVSVRWEHFHQKLQTKFVKSGDHIGSARGLARTHRQTLERSLTEITTESIELVNDLIAQNSLYRGAEHKRAITQLVDLKRDFGKATNKDAFLWLKSLELGPMSNIRGSVIGTLLTDLSEGIELDVAVGRFESKVAPENYKRPTALVTPKMIDAARKTVEELGIEASLHRRYAVLTDITINNVLFADSSIKPTLGVFDALSQSTNDKLPNLDKVEEVTIDHFLTNILPKATGVEVFFEHKHRGNLVSLIAPVYADSPNILKWGNNFSWSYAGEVTDSIKERVKAAGGNVTGDLRVSLSWYNYDDLDLHVRGSNGMHIYFGDSHDRKSDGRLDVDMNRSHNHSRTPVENITWPSKNKLPEMMYTVEVKNFNRREDKDFGFEVEIEYCGEKYNFSHDKETRSGQTVKIVDFNYSKANGVVIDGKTGTTLSTEMWGVNTNKFQKVKAIMHSPNHWDGEEIGNKHVFFMLDGCNNPEKSRGFYNEFLGNHLNEHRKVFEVLGSTLKTPESDQQLSGLGFSTTKHDTVVCRVSGSFNRVIKIKF